MNKFKPYLITAAVCVVVLIAVYGFIGPKLPASVQKLFGIV